MVCHYASTCHARLPHFPFKYSSQIPDLLHLMWTCQQIPCAHHGQEFPGFEGSSKFISPWLHWPAFKLESIIWIFLSFFIVWGNDFLWSQTIRTPCESRFARKIASNSRLEGKEGSWPSQSKAFLKTVGSKQMSRQEFLWIHILGIWKGIISLFGSRMQRRNRCKLRSFKGPDGWVTDHKKRSSNTLVPCIAASSSWLLIENAADAVIHAYTDTYIYKSHRLSPLPSSSHFCFFLTRCNWSCAKCLVFQLSSSDGSCIEKPAVISKKKSTRHASAPSPFSYLYLVLPRFRRDFSNSTGKLWDRLSITSFRLRGACFHWCKRRACLE